MKTKSLETKIAPGFWASLHIDHPIPEYRFHPVRKWRIDYAWPDILLAVEIEGGVWVKGRHTRGKGFSGDMEKYNELAEMGWVLLRYEPSKIDFLQIQRVFISRKTKYEQNDN
jgi:very-short-patch-repair endonuclease